eukprot:UN23944
MAIKRRDLVNQKFGSVRKKAPGVESGITAQAQDDIFFEWEHEKVEEEEDDPMNQIFGRGKADTDLEFLVGQDKIAEMKQAQAAKAKSKRPDRPTTTDSKNEMERVPTLRIL